MTRAEEIQAIDEAVRAGKCTRYPTGHHSGGEPTAYNFLFGKPKAEVVRRSGSSRTRRKVISTKAAKRCRKG